MMRSMVAAVIGGLVGFAILQIVAEMAGWGDPIAVLLLVSAGAGIAVTTMGRNRTVRAGSIVGGLVLLIGLMTAQSYTFKPGDRGIPSEAWSGWHGLAPGNKSKTFNINYTASTDSTVTFGFRADYVWGFTTSADCSIRAYILPTSEMATDQSIDTTRYIYIPSGASFDIGEMWTGFKLKGKGAGKLNGRAVGRTY